MTMNNFKSLSTLAKSANGKKGREILTVSVDDVESKIQVRKRFRNIGELAITLLTEGQQFPIIVFPKNADGKYIIQKGERRWRACKHAGIQTIDIVINDKIQSNLDETAGELIENIQRDNLTPVEIAEALNQFIQERWKQKDIADRIGKNTTYVSTHLSLLKMPDCVRELYDNEICSDTETLNNLRLLFELNQECSRTVCAVAMNDGITRKQSRELLNDAKRIREELEKRAPLGLRQTDNDNNLAPNYEQRNPLTGSQDNSKKEGESSTEDDKELITKSTIQDDTGSEALLPLPKDKGWKNVRPESLVFIVNVNVDCKSKRGVIMTDRVALNPGTVWVKTLDAQGKENPVYVSVSDIELVSVEG
ncbi:ParB/RepB/Spo0J family partition protein [Photorhabdus caribbeanensis]|uniref:ParB/RepB/Spo0J family partition protein n=1 Tax=Photorhabdus caribbeanensis TaxID=1004165 RepID=UPI001BD5A136|nr:KorB domain-containing protein [Photorhabdus caribbeanensis]MBS9424191.1 ParB/RepB/Spo0J family partition protein [Photorhabdus caribbeanensis]